MELTFELPGSTGAGHLQTDINQLIVAGWTGRDPQAILHHISELEALGVPRPSATPLFYRVAANQLTQQEVIEVMGGATSGEVEPLVFSHQGCLYVSLASDHTDRRLETHSIALSKQICAKPVARTAWPLHEVAGHWDQLILRSWIREDGDLRLYQQGTLASLRKPAELLECYFSSQEMLARGLTPSSGPIDGLAIVCGTVAAIGGIRPSTEFRMALVDDVLGRTITHRYYCTELPVVA